MEPIENGQTDRITKQKNIGAERYKGIVPLRGRKMIRDRAS